MTDEQERRAESRKQREAFAGRVDRLFAEVAASSRFDGGISEAVRLILAEGLQREDRVTERRIRRFYEGR